ncbi:MAG: ABC transporter permease, partial [Butyrivibrio sp.]|nr:ABC transporter permease [Butyrivibrio sp.]
MEEKMKNNNGASIRKLSNRSLRSSRLRNIFAVLAIILTCVLFTAAFSLTGGAIQTAQEDTMREVGTRAHVGLKSVTAQQYDRITADPMIESSDYNILIGTADNLVKRMAELRCIPEEDGLQALYHMFISLEEGRMPAAEREIIVDTFVLDELRLPHALGVKVPLVFSFMGEQIEEEFEVCGWYQGDAVSHASELVLSEAYWRKLKGTLTDEDFLRWEEQHPEDNGVGLRNGDLFFENERNLEEKVQEVIRSAGYEPGAEVAYGVNWAHMSSRVEAVDPFTLAILL